MQSGEGPEAGDLGDQLGGGRGVSERANQELEEAGSSGNAEKWTYGDMFSGEK